MESRPQTQNKRKGQKRARQRHRSPNDTTINNELLRTPLHTPSTSVVDGTAENKEDMDYSVETASNVKPAYIDLSETAENEEETDDSPETKKRGDEFEISDEDIEEAGKVVISSFINISCAPLAILLRYNLLEPQAWEDGPVEISLSNNGKKTFSYYYVSLGRNLLKVGLVSGIRNTILSIKQCCERGNNILFTHNRHAIFGANPSGDDFATVVGSRYLVFSRSAESSVTAEINTRGDVDEYVLLESIEPDLKVPLLFQDHRTLPVMMRRRRV